MLKHIASGITAALLFAPLAHGSNTTQLFTRVAGLTDAATVVRDDTGIPHVFARSERDALFLQGWLHARDRLFQMDVDRRTAEGTVAELLGSTAIPSDVELRIFGARRAAEHSWPLLSSESQAGLRAYAAGVNAYIARNPLPAEYAALEISTVRPWTEIDSLSVLSLVLFGQSFDLTDINRSNALMRYRAVGTAQGFDGNALFFEDVLRIAPFDPAATVSSTRRPSLMSFGASSAQEVELDSSLLNDGMAFIERLQSAPHARRAVRLDRDPRGSNAFVIAGRLSTTGRPILASDPHLLLPTPAVFYEIQLHAPGLEIIGASFPGMPYVVLGHNDRIAWGVTNHPVDLTDVYQEQLVVDATSPSGLSTLHRGAREHVVALPQVFRTNIIGDGVADSLTLVPGSAGVPSQVFIVPRRNSGPLVSINSSTGAALSVQYTAMSGHRTLDAFRALERAADLDDFERALQDVDGAAFNFVYADTKGNIAYRATGEIPVREDLQAGAVAGLPPFFVRNGQGGNEWLPAQGADADRALSFEILASDELPAATNPANGVLITANNDPVGSSDDNDALNETRANGGILYVGATFDTGIRAGRIRDLFAERQARGRRLGTRDMADVQADVVMGDARFFTPHIITALRNAQRADAPAALHALAQDTRVQEAVGRLAAWDQSSPTGIAEGYDASDIDGRRATPSSAEIANSVAATLYSTWSGQMILRTLVATLSARNLPTLSPQAEAFTALQRLLREFPERRGVGASGIDFFAMPGIANAEDRRDLVILRSLASALDLLASPALADAFGGSTNQHDYRWGRLHRLILNHPIGGQFDLPSSAGGFPPPLDDLAGIPVDGGLFTVDLAPSAIVQQDSSDFMFGGGPARRYIARAQPFGFEAVTSLPGGESGAIDSPFHANLLPLWLTNDTVPLRQELVDLLSHAHDVAVFIPGP
ncbi:MAG: penicillin acylase family protein [Steroidobacter sp.]